MKSLIIIKGLAKSEKLKWVYEEGLSNYFLDLDVFQKIYSIPELISPNVDVLNRSYGSLVHRRFMEALILKMGKGCLIVIDMNEEPISAVELLAKIHGYTVFYNIQSVPQDFCNKPEDYHLDWKPKKQRDNLEAEVRNFMSTRFDDKIIIKNYQDVLNWWEEHETVINLKRKDRITHISDLHSHWNLWKELVPGISSKIVIHHGDYIDGPESGGAFKMIREIITDNSQGKYVWLEGNHEIRLRRYLGWRIISSSGSSKTISELLYDLLPEDFLQTTATEFEKLTIRECRVWLDELNNKLRTHAVICRDGINYICTHAGIKLIEQLTPKHIGNAIYGNRDVDKYDKEFSFRNKGTGFLSIHAHCKYPYGWDTNKYSNVVNIDPEDEFSVVMFYNNKDNWKFKVYGKDNNNSKEL